MYQTIFNHTKEALFLQKRRDTNKGFVAQNLKLALNNGLIIQNPKTQQTHHNL